MRIKIKNRGVCLCKGTSFTSLLHPPYIPSHLLPPYPYIPPLYTPYPHTPFF
ncbi:hypothetical protein NBO_6g0052 [Nosema bombycis CQ1]|uniref:Uncharacterized protein n=1 Tax=Nosema bombycis (strain CQ1 / CVCC 102059) TaxID=578461 RepID=R0MM46_NOSB1|nr:hypothetical protein NBO_6g0052 [Nosema bombycis CQ1]|eukprot:EOB15300.1 hypothetical protein NBO_6g0052 [Nosema bombycis CQ1]